MRRRLQRVGRDEVVGLEEVAAHLRREEHDGAEQDQEADHAHQVVHRVVRVERDAVQRDAVGVLLGLDLDAVRIVGAHFVQRDDVRDDQAQQDQRDRDHVEAEEAVQRGVRHHVVAADHQREIGADERDRREQVDDHLRAPVRHLAPGQQVAHEGLAHQAQEDRAAEDPDQFARFPVRPVQEAAEHVHVHDDEERRGAGGVHVAHQPAPRDVAHDVLDRRERERRIGLVVHHQEDARDDLDHQHQRREDAEEVPEIEVLRRVVLGSVILPELGRGEAVVDPGQQLDTGRGVGWGYLEFRHAVLLFCSTARRDAAKSSPPSSQAFVVSSSPMISL